MLIAGIKHCRWNLIFVPACSVAGDGGDLSVLGGGDRHGSCGRDGDEDAEVHHRAVAGAGVKTQFWSQDDT